MIMDKYKHELLQTLKKNITKEFYISEKSSGEYFEKSCNKIVDNMFNFFLIKKVKKDLLFLLDKKHGELKNCYKQELKEKIKGEIEGFNKSIDIIDCYLIKVERGDYD